MTASAVAMKWTVTLSTFDGNVSDGAEAAEIPSCADARCPRRFRLPADSRSRGVGGPAAWLRRPLWRRRLFRRFRLPPGAVRGRGPGGRLHGAPAARVVAGREEARPLRLRGLRRLHGRCRDG